MAQEALAALSNEASHWKTLSVDLEKKKVLFPDWSKAKHFTGKTHTLSLSSFGLFSDMYEDRTNLIILVSMTIIIPV